MSPQRTVSIYEEEKWSPIEEDYKKIVLEFMNLKNDIRSLLSKHQSRDIMFGRESVDLAPIRKQYRIGDDLFWIQEEKSKLNLFSLIEVDGGISYPVIFHYTSYYPIRENGKITLRKRIKIKEDLSPRLLSPPPSPERRNSKGKEPSSPIRILSPKILSREKDSFSAKECEEWKKNKRVNPRTGRKIAKGKAIYKKLSKDCE